MRIEDRLKISEKNLLEDGIDKRFKLYKLDFASIADLHLFLSSEPPINHEVFRHVKSVTDKNSAKEQYEDCLNILAGNIEYNTEQFLQMKHTLDISVPNLADVRIKEKSVVGHRPNVPAFLAGLPKNMYRLKRNEENKFVTIHFECGNANYETEQTILNRGILTLNLIKLLEANNYKVNFNCFYLVNLRNDKKDLEETVYMQINMKNIYERINIKRCFFPMCSPAFNRRLLFRVLETLPVEQAKWGEGYGNHVSYEKIGDFVELDENSIVVGLPWVMEIYGEDFEKDSENFIKNIKLDKYIKTK